MSYSHEEWKKKEFDLLKDKNKDEYGSMVVDAVKELADVFDNQGHSGLSAEMTKQTFDRFADHMCLTPLTGEDDEWEKEGLIDECFQNKRHCSLFKDRDGTVHDIERAVFIDKKTGVMFQGKLPTKIVDKYFPITFPYYPSMNKYIVYGTEKANGKHFIDYVITPDYKVIRIKKTFL